MELIHNPYLQEFLTFRHRSKKAAGLAAPMWNFEHRDGLRKKYAYSLADNETVSTVASYCRDKPLVDIGAGTGYWSYLLDQMGVNCHAYDKDPYENNYCEGHWHIVNKVQAIGLKNLYTSAHVLLSWPPYATVMAEQALDFYLGLPDPGYFIYIGEPKGHATGDDGFFDKLDTYCQQVRTVQNPTYPGLYDCVEIYKLI